MRYRDVIAFITGVVIAIFILLIIVSYQKESSRGLQCENKGGVYVSHICFDVKTIPLT